MAEPITEILFKLPETYDIGGLSDFVFSLHDYGIAGMSNTDVEFAVHASSEAPFTAEQAKVIARHVASYVYVRPYNYAELRVAEYDKRIPIGAQLDALAKGIDGPEWAAVVAERTAIKTEFPKARPASWK